MLACLTEYILSDLCFFACSLSFRLQSLVAFLNGAPYLSSFWCVITSALCAQQACGMAMWPNTRRSCCNALQNFIALVPLALILGDVTEGEVVLLLFVCNSPSAGSCSAD